MSSSEKQIKVATMNVKAVVSKLSEQDGRLAAMEGRISSLEAKIAQLQKTADPHARAAEFAARFGSGPTGV